MFYPTFRGGKNRIGCLGKGRWLMTQDGVDTRIRYKEVTLQEINSIFLSLSPLNGALFRIETFSTVTVRQKLIEINLLVSRSAYDNRATAGLVFKLSRFRAARQTPKINKNFNTTGRDEVINKISDQ